MTENTNTNSYYGLGVFDLLGVAFIVLKLTDIITWSWWWVLSPFWIQGALIAILFVVAFIIVIINEVKK